MIGVPMEWRRQDVLTSYTVGVAVVVIVLLLPWLDLNAIMVVVIVAPPRVAKVRHAGK